MLHWGVLKENAPIAIKGVITERILYFWSNCPFEKWV